MKNIILIIVDGLRPKNMSLYGYPNENDKNMKKIIDEGFFFKNHFSSSNSTLPSLTSLFNGLYPDKSIGHQSNFVPEEDIKKLSKSNFWLPSYLKSKGYYTMSIDWIGLWLKKGFEFYGESNPAEKNFGIFSKIKNIKIINKLIRSLPNSAYKLWRKLKKKTNFHNYNSAKKVTDFSIKKIKESGKPFFLFMHYWDTHWPFHSAKYNPSGKKDFREILKKIDSESQKKFTEKMIIDSELYSMYSIDDMINKYNCALRDIDDQIGKLKKFLIKEKLWQETILIILGDHGWRVDEHNIYFNGYGLYDETVHTPLIIKIPGMRKGKTNELVQNVDVAPTIIESLGFKKEKGFDGRSLIPLMTKNKSIRQKAKLFDAVSPDTKAIRTKNKKIIISKDATCGRCKTKHHKEKEIYDLIKDPDELNNLA